MIYISGEDDEGPAEFPREIRHVNITHICLWVMRTDKYYRYESLT